jgi:hypothetical protein
VRVADGALARRPDGLDARIAADRPAARHPLNNELYRSQWFAAEALARADLATHRDALAAVGWMLVNRHEEYRTPVVSTSD